MVITNEVSNKYYVCKSGRKPIFWNPLDTNLVPDPNCIFFGKVFEVMEKRLKVNNLTFYLTWDIQELPSYGQDVVAIVLGDEWCRIPSYFHKVRAVFKCYGTRPILGCNPLFKPSYLNFLTLGQFLQAWVNGLPGLMNYTLHKFKHLRQLEKIKKNIYDIPLGYYKQLNLPIKNIENRRDDVFFAGSLIQNQYSVTSLKYWLGNPKLISRKKMISSIDKLKKKCPNLKIELSITSSFHTTSDAEGKSYSEKMMESKICLVPRGTSFETFRFFEALRYGCIVVVEALPPRWFYDNSPAIQINDWNELEAVVKKIIENRKLMKEKHQESLNWWKTKCSEAAVAEYIAENINSIQIK